MSTCLTCGKVILEPNAAYGINPQAVCVCCSHNRKAAPVNELAAAGGYSNGKPFVGIAVPEKKNG